jgi:hypothetical protein
MLNNPTSPLSPALRSAVLDVHAVGAQTRDPIRLADAASHAASCGERARKARAARSARSDGARAARDGSSPRRGARDGHRDASGAHGSGHVRTAAAPGSRGGSRCVAACTERGLLVDDVGRRRGLLDGLGRGTRVRLRREALSVELAVVWPRWTDPRNRRRHSPPTSAAQRATCDAEFRVRCRTFPCSARTAC